MKYLVCKVDLQQHPQTITLLDWECDHPLPAILNDQVRVLARRMHLRDHRQVVTPLLPSLQHPQLLLQVAHVPPVPPPDQHLLLPLHSPKRCPLFALLDRKGNAISTHRLYKRLLIPPSYSNSNNVDREVQSHLETVEQDHYQIHLEVHYKSHQHPPLPEYSLYLKFGHEKYFGKIM